MHSSCLCGRFPIVRAEIHGRVLVVDDEPLVRWALVAGLRHAGFDAAGAAGPEEAEKLAPPPDLILLDVGLWGRDPLHVLEAIRSIAPLARILLLAVEGQAVPVPAWQDVDVIRKPFDLDAVVRRVGTTLACQSHGVRMAV
jgi:DNA-binding response OmpR family regulator